MPLGARKDGKYLAVSIMPDVCLTPMGGGMVPVPYQIIATLEGSEMVADTVHFNSRPAFKWDCSKAPRVTGDEPGTGGGVKSGVNVGKVWADHASRNVRAEGLRIVRVGDMCWMNLKG